MPFKCPSQPPFLQFKSRVNLLFRNLVYCIVVTIQISILLLKYSKILSLLLLQYRKRPYYITCGAYFQYTEILLRSLKVQLKLILTDVFTYTSVLTNSEFPDRWSTLIGREEAEVSQLFTAQLYIHLASQTRTSQSLFTF